jgi:hypothetical protein
MHFRPAYAIALMLIACGIGSTQADVLKMPETPPAQREAESMAMNLPAKGMSMNQVEREFGAPEQKMAPVGDPPISRWVYPNYTVYFEYKYVIHSVMNK